MKDNTKDLMIIAGPCTVESYDRLYATAYKLKEMGIKYLRSGAYKMRSRHNSFQGLKDEGVEILSRVGKELGLRTVSEITRLDKIEYMAKRVDILVVGTRSMNNYPLLEALGIIHNPVILKRGFAASYTEWHASSEYITKSGKTNVILCERGIRTFEPQTRYTLDMSAIPVMQQNYNMPIIIDPSHASGKRELVAPLSKAAIACGANGLMIECDLDPDSCVCDAKQTIAPEVLQDILSFIKRVKEAENGK